MQDVKKLNLSENWILKNGWRINLGDLGDGYIEDGELWSCEVDVNFLQYHYKGWVFSDCYLAINIPWSEVPNIKFLDDAFKFINEDNGVVFPNKNTKVLKIGDPKDIIKTEFEDFIKKEGGN